MENESPPDSSQSDSHNQDVSGGLAAFWHELKRRKVVRVAIAYAVVGWLVIQVAATTFPPFMSPSL